MKIGLIADIHGNNIACRKVLSTLYDRVDKILFAGDLVGYYPFVNECVRYWNENKIVSIYGNHDKILLDWLNNNKKPNETYNLKFGNALERTKNTLSEKTASILSSWPSKQTIHLNHTTILMVHGAPWNIFNGRVYPDFNEWYRFNDYKSDIIICGHTHYQLFKSYKGKLIINPGSVGQPRDSSLGASFAELNLDNGQVKHYRLEYDSYPLIKDSEKYNFSVPYLKEVLVR